MDVGAGYTGKAFTYTGAGGTAATGKAFAASA